MRATVISTGRHFSIVRTLEGEQDIHMPTDKVKRVEFRQGSKEPVPAVRHIRSLKQGEIVEVFETEGKLRQERGKIILPTALAVGFEDEIEILKIAGPSGRAESYLFLAEVLDGNGQVIKTLTVFKGSLRELLDTYPADRDVRVIRPIKAEYPAAQRVQLHFEVKLMGREGFISCPDPRLWHLPEPEQPKPAPTPAAKTPARPARDSTGKTYCVYRLLLDPNPQSNELLSELLAENISVKEYNARFRDKLDEHLVGAMHVIVVLRDPEGVKRHIYTRYDSQYQVGPEPAVIETASA